MRKKKPSTDDLLFNIADCTPKNIDKYLSDRKN